MTQAQQAKLLTEDIVRVLDHFRSEFDLNLVTVLGVLELIKLDLFRQEMEGDEGDDTDSSPE